MVMGLPAAITCRRVASSASPQPSARAMAMRSSANPLTPARAAPASQRRTAGSAISRGQRPPYLPMPRARASSALEHLSRRKLASGSRER